MTGVPIIPAELLEPTSADMAEVRALYDDCWSPSDARQALAGWGGHIDNLAVAMTSGDVERAAQLVRLMRASRRAHADWAEAFALAEQSADVQW
ncbi:hypothetical protein MXD59_12625 [Frankia sp. Ag45/Mut15]|uniref:Uncharacterized protein n=1 Tax=Frankia umida TaxID=573489 RepID=A0ABT0JZF9_9ACTN|nr:hypothetical protein [Frankia umida]MCK9876612.1 hypothetical protein [Frankia umida]